MTITLLEFQYQGACRDHDPELFFPMSEAAAHEEQIGEAKAVCRSCPVLSKCRAYALDNAVDGIWGGMTEDERRKTRAWELQREVAAAHVCDQSDADEPADESARSASVLPSYQTARNRLSKARRALTLAQQAGDADAISRAEQRVADAADQFAAVRAQDTAGAVA